MMKQNATHIHGSNELIDHANAAFRLSKALERQREVAEHIASLKPQYREFQAEHLKAAAFDVALARAEEFAARQFYVNPFQAVKTV